MYYLPGGFYLVIGLLVMINGKKFQVDVRKEIISPKSMIRWCYIQAVKSGRGTKGTVFVVPVEKPGSIMGAGNIILEMNNFFSFRESDKSRDVTCRIYKTVQHRRS